VATTTYEAELGLNNPNNMMKALGGFIVVADITTAIPSAFTQNSTADLIQLDTTLWHRVGLVTQKDGVQFSRNTKNDDENSWGYIESTRTDITEDTVSGQFTMQEINRWTQELYDMVDLSAVHPDATTGEFGWNKAAAADPDLQAGHLRRRGWHRHRPTLPHQDHAEGADHRGQGRVVEQLRGRRVPGDAHREDRRHAGLLGAHRHGRPWPEVAQHGGLLHLIPRGGR
jgi:hypothetical protein